MTFAIVSRTALVTMPMMLAVFALLHLKMADHRDPTMRDDCIRRAGLGNVASVALEGGNRSILLRKADIGDG
jgi:hypothetical protein